METVAAAQTFIAANGGNVTAKENPRNRLEIAIAAFLAWPTERVKHALAQLNAIEEGELSKKAEETLPTI